MYVIFIEFCMKENILEKTEPMSQYLFMIFKKLYIFSKDRMQSVMKTVRIFIKKGYGKDVHQRKSPTVVLKIITKVCMLT